LERTAAVSLDRVIVVAVGIAALAVAAPRFAPRLLGLVVAPPAEEEVAAAPAAKPPDLVPETVVAREREDTGTVQRLGGRRVALRADPRGHYEVDAIVNGRAVTVMVDTGATTVALNAASARRLGLFLSQRDYTVPIATANGVVAAAPVTLSEIRLGGISVRNVKAVVMPGEVLPINLLGMTFLSRLSKFEIADGRLVLMQ
jgi:aspartyl protease family protein